MLSVHRLLWLLALVALALLALTIHSCGPEKGPATGSGRLVRPVVTTAGGPGLAQEARTYTRLQVGEELEPWQLTGNVKSFIVKAGPKSPGQRHLQLRGRGARAIHIPGTFDPREFNRVIVVGRFDGVLGAQITLKGEKDFQSKTLSTRNLGGREQNISFDLTRLRMRTKPFDELVLTLTPTKNAPVGLEIRSIDLVSMPLANSLPSVNGDHGLISVAGESRTGFGLTSSQPVSTRFRAQPGDTLAFAHGQPAELAMPKQHAHVKLTLHAGAEELFSKRYATNEKGWKSESVDLAQWIGQDLEAHFALEVKGNNEGITAIGEFHVWSPAKAPKTVVLLTSDTHRGDHVGFADSPVEVATPTLDALAEKGVVFTDCWSVSNVTSPSHVSIMTGRHVRDHKVVTNTGRMHTRADTLAEQFRQAGWATAAVASVRHLGPLGTGLGQGFDRMIAPMRLTYDADHSIDELVKMIDEAKGKPLFLWLHLFDAHHPYVPPKEFDRKYYPKDKDPFGEEFPELEYAPGTMPQDLLMLRDLEFPKAQYRAEIDALDAELQRVFSIPRIEKAWVGFTSDHGEILAAHGTHFNHTEIYPDTLHVPMFVTGPGVPSGKRLAHPVTNIDVGRTLLDVAGLARARFPGTNMLRYLDQDVDPEAPRYALSAHGFSASITKGDWYFLLSLKRHKGALPTERPQFHAELFRWRDDPNCENELSASEPEKAGELCALLRKWLETVDGPDLTAQGQTSMEEMQGLEALGYASEEEEDSGGPAGWLGADPDCDPCAQFHND